MAGDFSIKYENEKTEIFSFINDTVHVVECSD